MAVFLAAGSHSDRYWPASFKQLDPCSLQAVSEQGCPHSGEKEKNTKKAVGLEEEGEAPQMYPLPSQLTAGTCCAVVT